MSEEKTSYAMTWLGCSLQEVLQARKYNLNAEEIAYIGNQLVSYNEDINIRQSD